MSGKQGFKTPYEGGVTVLKKLFAYTDAKRMTNEEVGELLGLSGSVVSAWKAGKYDPSRSSRKIIENYLKGLDDNQQMVLVEVKPPKDKKDGAIYTYRTDTPWQKSSKPKELPVVSDEELIEYAIKGMPEEVRNALLKKMLTERKKNG